MISDALLKMDNKIKRGVARCERQLYLHGAFCLTIGSVRFVTSLI